jgi:hypothetical protein
MSRGKVRKQSLFFDKTTTPATEAEAAAFTSVSATGARVADVYYGWADQARQVLALYPEWAGLQPTVPEWLDTEYPHHAWHLICLVAQGLPKYDPPAGCNLTADEQRAAEVLLRLSRVQEAARPFADRLELVFPLIEASISLGSEVVAATVEPYERYADAQLSNAVNRRFREAAAENNQQRHKDSQELYAKWQREAERRYWSVNPKMSARQAGHKLVDDLGITTHNGDTVGRRLKKPPHK